MTMSRMQFAVALVLTASGMGVGVGWLSHRQVEGVKQELVALREEMRTLRERPVEGKATPSAPVRNVAPDLYKGKSAAEWLEVLRDGDPEYRIKAIEPLAVLARADRTLIPVLLGVLRDDSDKDVRAVTAEHCQKLDLPAREAVPVLLHSNVAPSLVLPTLLRIDPRGKVSLPLVLAALKDKRACVRRVAAFALYAFDKTKARLALSIYMESLPVWTEDIPNVLDLDSEPRPENTVAAAILGELGPTARVAVPGLVEQFISVPKPSFITALKQIDPQGDISIPRLLERSRSEKNHLLERCWAIRGIGAVGADIAPKALLPLLQLIRPGATDNREILEAALDGIGDLGPAGSSAVPALMDVLVRTEGRDDGYYSDADVFAAKALGNIGPKAKAAFPILLKKWKKDPHRHYGIFARALLQIAPEAAAKAGVRLPSATEVSEER